jgi:hypothetical protein
MSRASSASGFAEDVAVFVHAEVSRRGSTVSAARMIFVFDSADRASLSPYSICEIATSSAFW